MEFEPTGGVMTIPILTDSGLETWLVFHKGLDLRDFAAFPLLDDTDGLVMLSEYFRDHLAVAARADVGIVLETPTWRANADWGARLGYDSIALDRINRKAIEFVRDIAGEFPEVDVVVSGNIGPRGDGYDPEDLMSPDEAEDYHQAQVESFALAGADRITMLTATHVGEAIGVIRAAVASRVPVVTAFTVETDGKLPSGQALHAAVVEADEATEGKALYFGINCAHPDHFAASLDAQQAGTARLGLLRANASRMSHAELDGATELDDGDPEGLGASYAELLAIHPHFEVLGGCCGTDVRHIEAIATACVGSARR